jgi:hypothetical protein
VNIKWTDKITNDELWRITKQKPIEIQIKRRKWNWIGHTLCKRTMEDEIRNTGRSWNEVKGIAGDCNAWKLFMDALCSTRSKKI